MASMLSGHVAEEFIVASFFIVLSVFVGITIWTFKLHDKKLLNEKASLPFNDERRDFNG
jgi:cbb3-type cytochrome oxidase subunit 3